MKKILVTGGAGYKGCILAQKLLDKGYEVVVYDLMLFGDEGLPKANGKLKKIKADIRDIEAFKKALKGVDGVIHMACMSNDPSYEYDPGLSKSINFDCFEPMVAAAKEAGVKRFIYVSSSSVYGVSESPDVTEEHPLLPLTDYNKYKGLCEPILNKYRSDDFVTIVMRPATVCGYSPRMRFDLSVNILTNHAVNKGKITVFGGTQKRPNIHVDDICELYVDMLEHPAEKVSGEKFNAAYENHSIADLANFVKKVVEEEFPEKAPIDIVTTPSNDIRSYHVSSKKVAEVLGYKPKRTIEDAIRDICAAFKRGEFKDSFDNDTYYNIKQVKALRLK